MSGPVHFDPLAAAPTWVCAFCGLLRVYEGGRPLGLTDRNDCRECGSRLAASPEDWTAIAQHEAVRQRRRVLIDEHLF